MPNYYVHIPPFLKLILKSPIVAEGQYLLWCPELYANTRGRGRTGRDGFAIWQLPRSKKLRLIGV